MADATLVQVFDAADELPVKLGSLLFIQACISDDEVEEFATVGVLHDHEKFLLSLYDLNFKAQARRSVREASKRKAQTQQRNY